MADQVAAVLERALHRQEIDVSEARRALSDFELSKRATVCWECGMSYVPVANSTTTPCGHPA